jgi:hypothetical protein
VGALGAVDMTRGATGWRRAKGGRGVEGAGESSAAWASFLQNVARKGAIWTVNVATGAA